MKIADANVLINAANRDAREHLRARTWIESALGGTEGVGFAWITILAFLRVGTRTGVLSKPLRISDAFAVLEDWLHARNAHLIQPGGNHLAILRSLLQQSGTGGNLTTDAHLAALAIEHGAELVSFDRDFDRFDGLRTVILKA